MPPPNDLGTTSLMTSLGVLLIAAFLGLRQWYEWRAREADLSGQDRAHFFHQDLRRGIGVGLLLFVALGIWVGAHVPPRIGGRANIWFVDIWLLEITLVVALLLLAIADLFATRAYALRHRQSIARERRAMLRETLRQAYSVPPEDASKPDKGAE